jgi:hypothetical protein
LRTKPTNRLPLCLDRLLVGNGLCRNITYVENVNPDGLQARRAIGVNGTWPFVPRPFGLPSVPQRDWLTPIIPKPSSSLRWMCVYMINQTTSSSRHPRRHPQDPCPQRTRRYRYGSPYARKLLQRIELHGRRCWCHSVVSLPFLLMTRSFSSSIREAVSPGLSVFCSSFWADFFCVLNWSIPARSPLVLRSTTRYVQGAALLFHGRPSGRGGTSTDWLFSPSFGRPFRSRHRCKREPTGSMVTTPDSIPT